MLTIKTTNESLNKALDEITRARDEAKLTLHLLSAEAKDKWSELEGKLQQLEGQLSEKGEKATEQSAAKVHELAANLRQFVQSHVKQS
jgi:hypothetical protein